MRHRSQISDEYIRGLTEGEGTFTFCKSGRYSIPTFTLKMNARDKKLLEMVRDHLELKNKVYEYNHQGKDGYKRGSQAMLIVREIGSLKNKVVPFFYGNLVGNKGTQFESWLEKMGSIPEVPESYKIIHKLHKFGWYDKKKR